MIKTGFHLYATKSNGRWFVKQAKSQFHFVALCVADEKRNGYTVTRMSRDNYLPDFIWDTRTELWCWVDGRPYGKRLPVGAR